MKPYLSICMGVGGAMGKDLIDRLMASTRRTSDIARRQNLDVELIVVEWNVPLRDFGAIPIALEASTSVPTRMIHVPRKIHEEMPNPHGFRYFEWFPKNVGIRRARGEFVLSTNPDDLWSEELGAFFGRRELQRGHFYRVNRHDMRDGEVFAVLHPTGPLPPNASEAEIRKSRLPRCAPWSENMLHYNAAGDFTLMSRDDWFLIHGNPEHPWNDSVDGETLWLAHTHGLKQIVLPYPLYHPEHARTLNIAGNGQNYSPGWDDNRPRGTKNDDAWGFKDESFEETEM